MAPTYVQVLPWLGLRTTSQLAHHTQDRTGSLKPQATPRRHEVGSDAAAPRWGGVNAQEGRTQKMEGKPASVSASAASRDVQGIEFNRSFRKLSGSVTSDNRPGKQGRTEVVRNRHARPPAPLSHSCRIRAEHAVCPDKLRHGRSLGRPSPSKHSRSVRGVSCVPELGATVCLKALIRPRPTLWPPGAEVPSRVRGPPQGGPQHADTKCEAEGSSEGRVHSIQPILGGARAKEKLIPVPPRAGRTRAG